MLTVYAIRMSALSIGELLSQAMADLGGSVEAGEMALREELRGLRERVRESSEASLERLRELNVFCEIRPYQSVTDEALRADLLTGQTPQTS